ncbi:MAG: NusG domain II-containing protein, partial [Oscillospiraceae bacterium]|nr:NusG domain II-containing protein [Oscillospiraceae bacterium]
MKTKTLVIIISAVLAISLAASAILYFGGERKTAEIYVDGELLRSIDLAAVTETQTFTVETEEGRNVIEVERG